MSSDTSARRYALGVLVVAYTFSFIDRQILSILLPSIKVEFGVDDWVLGFLAGSAFALFYATLGVPIAVLADRGNRRNLIAVSLAIWSGMTALSGFAASIVHLTLARIGVGVGEAGLSPAAHSMIADYYPPRQRSTAMGIFTLGISAGIMIAYLAGGWVADNIGWREAFLIVGVPGLLLAVLMWLTVREPERGLSESLRDDGQRPPVIEVAKFLSTRPSFIYISVGAGLASFSGYAVASFFPTFLLRSHGMSLTDIGVYLGLVLGIAGGLGFAGGGYVGDRLGRHGQRFSLLGVAVATLVGWLFAFPVYLAENLTLVLAFFVVPAVFSNAYLAITLSHTQSMVGLRMRGVASAIMLFILNIIGLGLGPQVTGILSDLLAPAFGAESMRYALLLVIGVAAPISALSYFMASRTIESDLARANEG